MIKLSLLKRAASNERRAADCLTATPKVYAVVLCFVCWCSNVSLFAADTVIERYQELLHKAPKSGTVFDRVYNYYADAGESDVFVNQCKERTEKETDNAAAYILYGLVAERKSQLKIAAEAFRKAAELDTANYLPEYYLGKVLVADNQFRDGITALEAAVNRLKQTPANGKALRDVLQVLGQTLFRFGETEKAAAVWRELETLFPNDNDILIQVAEALEAGGQIDEAVKQYQKLITNTNDDYERVRLTLNVAELLLQKKDKPEPAIELLSGLLDQIDSENYLSEIVRGRIEQVYQRRRDTDGLITFYRQRLENRPNDTATVSHLAVLLQPAEAEKLLFDAVERSPKNAALRNVFIDVLTRQNKTAAAVQQCQAVDDIDSGNADNLIRWGTLLVQNTELDETQRKTEAVKIWHRISNDAPDDPVFATVVADLCLRNGIEDEAEQYYRKAFELKPEDFSYREHLARFYYAAQRKNKVLEVLLPEVDSETYSAEHALQIGRLLLQLGYIAECCQFCERQTDGDWNWQRLHVEALVKRGKPADIKTAFGLFSQVETSLENDKQFADFLKQETELLRQVQRFDETFQETEAVSAVQLPVYRYYWKLSAYQQTSGKLSAAVGAVEEALKLQPEPSAELRQFAAELFEQNGNTAKAAALYGQLAAERTPLRSVYLQRLAALQIQNGELDQALETSRNLLGNGGTANVRYYAELLLSVGRQNDAVNTLRQGLRNEPGSVDLLQLLARTLYDMNRKDEAFDIAYRHFETVKDLPGKSAVLDTLCQNFSSSEKIDELLNRLRSLNKSAETDYFIARVLLFSEYYDSARLLLEKILDGQRNGQAVSVDTVLKALVLVTEKQDDISAAIRYQEMLCRNNHDTGEQEHLFRLYESAGDTEKSGKLFLELTLRQSGLPEKLRAIDTMIRRGEYQIVLNVLDFLEIHESENWQLAFRRIVIQALQHKPIDAAVRDFLRYNFADTSNPSTQVSAVAAVPLPPSFEFAATIPSAFAESLTLQSNVYAKILYDNNTAAVLDEVKTFAEARCTAVGILLSEAKNSDVGENTAPAIWQNFISTVEAIRDSLPLESNQTAVLLDRLRFETMLLGLYENEQRRSNNQSFRQQLNFDFIQKYIRQIVRKLGISNAAGWDAALFSILIADAINETVTERFKEDKNDKKLAAHLAVILQEYCNRYKLPPLLPDETIHLVKLAEYIVKNARLQQSAADIDVPLTQDKRIGLLTDIWTKYGRSNQPDDVNLFENGIARHYSEFVWLLRLYDRDDNAVTAVLGVAAKRNPLWFVLKTDMFSYPVNADSLLFLPMANSEAIDKQLERLMPLLREALSFCNDNNQKAAMRDKIFQILDSLLYAPRLVRYDIFAPHERELIGKMPQQIREQLNLPPSSSDGFFARQLFGWEPYPPGSHQKLDAAQIRRVAELDYGVNRLLDFAVAALAEVPSEHVAGQQTVTAPMKPLAAYQQELTGAKPFSRNIMVPLVRHIAFMDVYSPVEDFFFRIALLYRALDTKSRYIVTQTETGTSLMRHDYTETFKKRLERMRYSSVPAERQLAVQICNKIDAVLQSNVGIKNEQPLQKPKDETVLLDEQLTALQQKQKLSASETLTLALCKAKRNRFIEVIPILDSMDLQTAADKKSREWIIADLVKRLGDNSDDLAKARGKTALERLMNYRLTDRELFDLLPAMQFFAMKDESQQTLERLITTTHDKKLQSDILYKIDSFGGDQRDNASKAALRILENPVFLDHPRHLTADLYLLDRAVGALRPEQKAAPIIRSFEERFRSKNNPTDGKIILAKFYLALERQEDAKRLAIEVSLTPPTDAERRQLVTSLLLHFGLQKELDAMNRVLTQRYNRR